MSATADNRVTITSIRFSHFKAFKNFHVTLSDFNVLVGPNNCGKSTIISSLKILEEGMRRARTTSPSLLHINDTDIRGYRVNLGNLPFATKNIFHDYDERTNAVISFHFSNGNKLELRFPEVGMCVLICMSKGPLIQTPTQFKNNYNFQISFVPTLGPVEDIEPFYLKETARSSLLSHGASRNFRNIWYHYPDGFDALKDAIGRTMGGIVINKPELNTSTSPTSLDMFFEENRMLREVYWAGFGFQVWLQLLTWIVKGRQSDMFVIDEPDIYLHSNLQRILMSILKALNLRIVIATHSTDMISEADPEDILVINKKDNSARRIENISDLHSLYEVLGARTTTVLTQISKTKKVLFLEGNDIKYVAKFASLLNCQQLADQSNYAVVQVGGFNVEKIVYFIDGVVNSLGKDIVFTSILDRDYRAEEECRKVNATLSKKLSQSHILGMKEIENILIGRNLIMKCVDDELKRQDRKTSGHETIVSDALNQIALEYKAYVLSQLQERYREFLRKQDQHIDGSESLRIVLDRYDDKFKNYDDCRCILPGKDIISAINKKLQPKLQITLSIPRLIAKVTVTDIDDDTKKALTAINGALSA